MDPREPANSWLRGCRWLAVVVLLALPVGCSGQAPATPPSDEPSVGIHIPVPQPFRLAAGGGSVWVLSRGPRPCSPAQPCTVSRFDPGINRLVGTPTRLPADEWDLAVGANSVWATQLNGRLIRIDARTGRIRARISARPIYLGSVVTVGGGSSGPATMTSATRAARCPRSIPSPIAWSATSLAWAARRASPSARARSGSPTTPAGWSRSIRGRSRSWRGDAWTSARTAWSSPPMPSMSLTPTVAACSRSTRKRSR
jgi:hypothetical protein